MSDPEDSYSKGLSIINESTILMITENKLCAAEKELTALRAENKELKNTIEFYFNGMKEAQAKIKELENEKTRQ